MNELLLIASLLVIFGGVLLAYRLFGKAGLYGATAIATILANIEVLILVDAFGMEQTLGNVLFASTYLITDFLSENESKKDANRAVNIGIFTAVSMVIITASWSLYKTSVNDWAAGPINTIFATTPRLILASLIGYAVSQKLDVLLYHTFWKVTSEKSGDSRKFLWIRNNGATLISQLINTVLFNGIAFYGMYETKTFISIMVSSYVIYVFTSLLDTPFLYIARKLKETGKIPE
ncbi:MAG: queuosine precursor transporter [Clostridia bacterium]|nr:queuosine precursor transporter [Clostridia bacterium]